MTIKKPQLTFGVEIELVRFWNGKPLIVTAETLIQNESDENLGGDGLLTFTAIPRTNGWDMQIIKAAIIDNNLNPIRQVDIDSDGNILPPWKENLDARDAFYGGRHEKGSALHQAKVLLDENGLHNWRTIGDSSLTDPGRSAIEIVSPILEMGDFNEIEKVCKIFSGITKIDQTCGLHVHMGQGDQGFEYESLKRLIERWMVTEPWVQNHPFYQPMGNQNDPITFHANLKQVKKTTNLDQLRSVINSGGVRDSLINLWSLNNYKTIEFRGFRSTLNIEVIKSIIKFCQERVLDSF